MPGLALLLKHSEHAVRARMRPALDKAGLIAEQWQIMAVLLNRPGTRMTDLAGAALVPAATLTRHMDRLAERALVVRGVDPGDRRRVVAALSPQGVRLARALRLAEQSIERSLSDGLGSARLEALSRELSSLPSLLTGAPAGRPPPGETPRSGRTGGRIPGS